jgi:hypothetical protein
MRNLKTYEDFLNEGRSSYDGLSSSLVKQTFKKWIADWKSKKASSSFIYSIEDKIEFDLESSIYFDSSVKGFEVLNSTGADSRDEDDDDDYQTPYIIIDFAVNPEWLPGYWQEIYMHLIDVMRHEIEHITQGGTYNYRAGKPDEDDTFTRQLITSGMLPKHTYLLLPKEIDANLQGLRAESKKRREPFNVTVDKYLNTQEYLTPETREEVLGKWRLRAKQIGGIPNF